ncbi:MAG: hypothetical protein ACYSU7_10715 [Planctomycetota bacterium]|jgi:hypothetical protein
MSQKSARLEPRVRATPGIPWRVTANERTGAVRPRDLPDPDVEPLVFNTAIAALRELGNAATASRGLT